MADVSNIITLGIGATPGKLLWFITTGLESAVVVAPAEPEVLEGFGGYKERGWDRPPEKIPPWWDRPGIKVPQDVSFRAAPPEAVRAVRQMLRDPVATEQDRLLKVAQRQYNALMARTGLRPDEMQAKLPPVKSASEERRDAKLRANRMAALERANQMKAAKEERDKLLNAQRMKNLKKANKARAKKKK